MSDVLVLRALALGDLLVSVPALRGLRRHFADHRIVLAAPRVLEPLARWSGAVDEVLDTSGPADLTWERAAPAAAVNLHGVGPQSHRALDATRPARRVGYRAPGWDGPDAAEVARRHPHERERWCALLAAHGIAADPADLALAAPAPDGARPAPVIVHPGAQYGAKRWPAARFAAVAAALHRAGHHVLVTGSDAERERADRVAAGAGLAADRVLAGRTDLRRFATLVAGAALMVCGDTGPAHLASAFGRPSVVLFGPVGPERWGPPPGGPHVVLTAADARRGDPFAAEPDPALLAVTVDDVLAAAAGLLQPRAATVSASRVVERPAR